MKYIVPILILVLVGCDSKKSVMQNEVIYSDTIPGTFGYDKAFLKKYKDIIELKAGNAQLLLVNDYQARVMTSTAGGDAGKSYGWMNYALIQSGELKPHMNAFGGEDRFWLGPEGGQYALYFKKGDPFDFDHWQTPALIDSEPFETITTDSTSATFKKAATLTNYHGFTFQFQIDRNIKLLAQSDVEKEFGIAINNVKAIAFQSTNAITNTGMKTGVRKTDSFPFGYWACSIRLTKPLFCFPMKNHNRKSK